MSKCNETSEKESSSHQDFVIRDGFPALRKPDGQPWLEGDEPLPPPSAPPVRIFANALVATTPQQELRGWTTLYQDCRTVFSARTRDQDAAYSAGITYFLPAAMQPRCALEGLVQAIFRAHTASLPPTSIITEQSGAEWWTLVLDDDDDDETKKTINDNEINKAPASLRRGVASKKSDAPTNDKQEEDDDDEEEEESDEVGLHFDADYGLEDQVTNLFLHPRLATVTYLTDHGAPTVVLERRSPKQGDMEALNGSIEKGWLCHPTRGRHLAFDGRLLHGAPATFFPANDGNRHQQASNDVGTKPPPTKKAKVDKEQDNEVEMLHSRNQRITLLVNIWVNHCPMDADLLDAEICVQLKTPHDAIQFTKELTKSLSPEKKVCLKASSADDPAGEEEVVIGNRIVTAHYGPTMQDLHAATALASTVEMTFEKDALRLVVGGLVPQDDSDDDDDEQEADE